MESKDYYRRVNVNSSRLPLVETIRSNKIILANEVWADAHYIPTSGSNLTTVLTLSNATSYTPDGLGWPLITRYIDATMALISGTYNTYYCATLINMIPSNYTVDYSYRARISVNGVDVPISKWEVNSGAGTVTFAGTKAELDTLFGAYLPVISFWSYIGSMTGDMLHSIYSTSESALPRSGGIMTGPINFNSYELTNVNTISGVNLNPVVFSGNVTVTGDLLVSGNQIIANTATVTIEDNIIRLNSALVGAPPLNTLAGIEVYRGTSPITNILFREEDEAWVLGELATLSCIATREDVPNNNAMGVWDSTALMFKTYLGFTYTSGNLIVPTINSLTISTSSAILTLANSSTFATTGAYSVTLTATGTTALTLPTAGIVFTRDQNLTSTSSSGGTLTLVASSKYIQRISGTLSHTVVMPVVTTLQLGHAYHIVNDTTGSVTINSSGSNAIATLTSYSTAIITCIAITGTTAASWFYTQTTRTTATSVQLNYLSSATGTTGSASVVYSTSPTLITPILGVASATSINKLLITAPATGSTLTIADGKTFTVSNTLTLTGTDSTSFAFPTSGGTVLTANSTATLTNKTWNSTIISPTYGGTGVNNGSSTITVAGNVSVTGAFTLALGLSASTSLTLPTAGIVFTRDQNLTNTASSGGTLTLVATSKYIQRISGTLSHTVVMPDVTTLQLGHAYHIVNDTTGTVTINSSGSNAIVTLSIYSTAIITCIAVTGTTAASWFFTQTSRTSATSVQLNYLSSATGTTGSASVVYSTSPTLITPTLGVASATSINKLLITAPATSATLTVADGKTLVVSNSLTFTGTDSTSFAFPSGSGTVITADSTATLINKIWQGTAVAIPFGGTGASAYTSGSLIFAGSSALLQNNTKLFWDNTNYFLGIGTNTPTCPLHTNNAYNIGINNQALNNTVYAPSVDDTTYYTTTQKNVLTINNSVNLTFGDDVSARWIAQSNFVDLPATYLDVASVQAQSNVVSNKRSATVGLSIASFNSSNNDSNGTITSNYSSLCESYNNSTGLITYNVGLGAISSNKSSGTVTGNYGIIALASNSATGTIGINCGLKAIVTNGGGTISNNYGILVELAISGESPNSYAIYCNNDFPTYLLGNLGLGVLSPTYKLHVAGTSFIDVATVTSVNKLLITAPATSATLAIADGKTLTVSNTLTLTGTDGATAVIPNGTLITADSTNTLTNKTWNSTTIDVAYGGTGASSYTIGSLLFAGSSALLQNNTKLFWDNTNYYLGIGNGAPTAHLHISPTAGSDMLRIGDDPTALFIIDVNGNVGIGAITINAKLCMIGNAVIQGNMTLSGPYSLGISGGDGMGYMYGAYNAVGNGIHFSYNYMNNNTNDYIPNISISTSKITSGPGYISFSTAGVNTIPIERMRIDVNGNQTVTGSINKLTITTSASGATLALASGSALATVGAYTTTLTTTGTTALTLPTAGIVFTRDQNLTNTSSTGGTLTLVASSKYIQRISGSASHTVVMPDVTTLQLGHVYHIINDTTGSVTINSSGSNAIVTLSTYSTAIITCIAVTGTTVASWFYTQTTRTTATSVQLNYLSSATGTTGTTNIVYSTSPTLVTPILGVASATTINKLTITAPATGSTLTIADGKALVVSNSLTFTGTDSTSFAFPSGNGTVITADSTATLTNKTWNSATVGLAYGGTGSTSFTAGSIVFSNGTLLTQDNANLFWDNTNDYLGIGIGTPLAKLHVAGNSTTPPQANISTISSYSIYLPSMGVNGSTSSGIAFGANSVVHASIIGYDDNTNDRMGLNFNTFNGTILSEKMRIDSNGNVAIGKSTAVFKLDVNGEIVSLNSAVFGAIGNSAGRPAASALPIAGEIHGYGCVTGGGALNTGSNDGFLRISAGGGTSTAHKTYIDLTGYSSTPDMLNNITLNTAGTERMRIDASGNVGIGLTPVRLFDVLKSYAAGSDIMTNKFAVSSATSDNAAYYLYASSNTIRMSNTAALASATYDAALWAAQVNVGITDASFTGTISALHGCYNRLRHLRTTTLTVGAAVLNLTENETTGIISTSYGSVNISNNKSTGSIGVNYGSFSRAMNAVAGVITTNTGTYTQAGNSNASGTINTNTGLRVATSNSGTITTNIGIQIDMATTGITNNYTIYASADVKSYLQGSLGLGINTPLAKLHIDNTGGSANAIQVDDGAVAINITGALTYQSDILTGTNTPPLSLIMSDLRNYDSGYGVEFNRGCHWIYNADIGNRYTAGGVIDSKNLAGISMAYHDHGGYAADGYQGNADIKFYTTSVISTALSTNEFTEKMRLSYDGNLGIGLTSPSYKVDINGNIRAEGAIITSSVSAEVVEYAVPPMTMTFDYTLYTSYTSIMMGKYVSFASSAYSPSTTTYASFRAFDNSDSNAWLSKSIYNTTTGVYNGTASLNATSGVVTGAILGEYVGIESPIPIKITNYRYKTRNSGSRGDPLSITMLGSNDKISWEALNVQVGLTSANNTIMPTPSTYWSITTSNYYRFFAIVVNTITNVNASPWVSINNIEFRGIPDNNIALRVRNDSAIVELFPISAGLVGIGMSAPTALLDITKIASTNSSASYLRILGAADTGITASTESPSVLFNFAATRSWATGALATQRFFRIDAPTIAFTAASTVTDISTLGITGAPIKGTNATMVNTHAIHIGASAVVGATRSYGLTCNAQTGATTNMCAQFIGGSVYVGSTAGTDTTALLELSSTTKGLLLPRMTTSNKTAISNSAGLVVYDTDEATPYVNDGSTWNRVYSYPIMTRLTITNGQNIPSGAITAMYMTVTPQYTSNYANPVDAASNNFRIRVPSVGYYYVSANVCMDINIPTSVCCNFTYRTFTSGAVAIEDNNICSMSGTPDRLRATFGFQIYISDITQYLVLYAYHTAGGNRVIASTGVNYSFVTIFKL